MPAPVEPTIARWQLGQELERLREGAKMSPKDVAQVLDCSDRKIRNIETARHGVSRSELLTMLKLYHVSDQEYVDRLLELAKIGKQRGWWVRFGQVPSVYAAYLGLETAAETLRSWELAVIPGLCQTGAYARAINSATMPSATSEQVERQVQLRLGRQERLESENPLSFWSVIDETALARIVGGADVMREQLQRLLDLAHLPNVTIQVLPLSHGAHVGTLGAFGILDFPTEARPPVVYIETFGGGGFLEGPEDLARFNNTYQHLISAALSPKESLRLISQRVKDY